MAEYRSPPRVAPSTLPEAPGVPEQARWLRESDRRKRHQDALSRRGGPRGRRKPSTDIPTRAVESFSGDR